MSRALRIAFVVSIAFNVLFICAAGALAGAILWGGAPGPGPVPPASMGMRFFLSQLPEETRARLGPTFEADRRAMKAVRREAQSARRAAIEAFVAEPFSADVLREKLAASRDADMKAVTSAHDAVVKLMSSLTPDERKIVADRLRDRVKRMDRFGPPEEGPGGPEAPGPAVGPLGEPGEGPNPPPLP